MIPEQELLLKKAQEALQAARLLLQNKLLNSSASRSFYAMFYTTQAFLLGYEANFSKPSALIAAFGKNFVKKGIVTPEFHRNLIDAEDCRNRADYDFEASITEQEAARQIQHAEQFLMLAKRLLG